MEYFAEVGTLSRREDEEPETPSDIEERTRQLMEKALGTSESTDVHDEGAPLAPSTSLAGQISETFFRIQIRMEDLISSIEDSIRSIEPEINESLKSTIESISERLRREAGLGVFTSKTVKIVREELEKALSVEAVHKGLFAALAESREQVRDIIQKTSRGSIREIDRRISTLQSKIVHVYARLNEREQEIDKLRSTITELRSKISEMNDIIARKDKEMAEYVKRLDSLLATRDQLAAKLVEQDSTISSLTGQLKQASSEILQLKTMIEKMDSAEELVVEYENMTKTLSELQGRLAELQETLKQKDMTIDELSETIKEFNAERSELQSRVQELDEEVSQLRGAKEGLLLEIETLRRKIAELQARWELLYQVAEESPAFRAYFVVADKEHWFPLSHLSSALGIPVVRLKQQLERFIEVGLLEIDGDRIRPKKLTEVVKEVLDQDERVLSEARGDLGMGDDTNNEQSDNDT